MASLWGELKQRNVVKVAVSYAIVGWLLIEICSILLPTFEAPEWVLKVIILLFGLGFVVAVFLAWLYELTPQGIMRTDSDPAQANIGTVSRRKISHAVIALFILAIALFTSIYWFVADETLLIAGQSSQSPEATNEVAEQVPLANSIAVLAFDDLSPDHDQEYFSDGISEEILNLLAHVDGLKVISRTSSFSFKGTGKDLRTIARELGVTHVLEGSVRKAGNQIRITAQLIEAATDTHLWSENYTHDLTNVFDIQDEIAANVVAVLRIKLLGNLTTAANSQRADNPEAHDAYLLGRHRLIFRRTEDMVAAREYFRSAIELDPDFAAPYVGLADTYIVQHMYGVMLLDEVVEEAKPAIERALQLDPQMGPAYTSRGWINWQQGDWAAAGEDFRRGISLSPNYATAHHWYSIFLFYALHRTEEAMAVMESALALDPLSPIINENAGRTKIWYGDVEGGLAHYRRANELIPRFPNYYRDVGEIEGINGRMGEAHRLFRTALSLDSGNPYLPYNIAYCYLVVGDIESAQQWFDVSAKLFGEKPAAELMQEFISLVVHGENPARLSQIAAQMDDWDILVWMNYRPVGRALLDDGDLSASRAFYKRFFPELFSEDKSKVVLFSANAAVDVAWILRREGDTELSERLLNETLAVATVEGPRGLVSKYLPEVRALAMLDRKTEALAALRKAIDDGWREIWWLNETDPTLKSIIGEPDFIAMVEEVEVDLATQLEFMRKMESNGEFAPVPDLVVTHR